MNNRLGTLTDNSKGWLSILFLHDSPLFIKTEHETLQAGAWEMATWLRTLATVANGLVPSTYMYVTYKQLNSSLRGYDTLWRHSSSECPIMTHPLIKACSSLLSKGTSLTLLSQVYFPSLYSQCYPVCFPPQVPPQVLPPLSTPLPSP